MSLLTWTKDAYGTNVDVADEQHQTLFAMLNSLHELAAASDRAAIGAKLDEVIRFVVMHFQMEETFMAEKGFAGLAAHKAAHDHFVGVCADLQKKFHAGEANLTQDTTLFVRDWLNNHIPKVDMLYGRN